MLWQIFQPDEAQGPNMPVGEDFPSLIIIRSFFAQAEGLLAEIEGILWVKLP